MKEYVKDSLDKQMIQRYDDCVASHPGAQLVCRTPEYPDFDKGIPPFHAVLRGELTHIMHWHGPVLLVEWVDSKRHQALFAEYGT